MRPSVLNGITGIFPRESVEMPGETQIRADNYHACELEDSASKVREVATWTFLYVTSPHN